MEHSTPVLNMLQGTEIVHSDLTAVIAGSVPSTTAGPGSSGWFPPGTFPNNPQYPQREQPFREFVLIYHDEIGAVQAFPQFEQPELEFTLHSGRDGFAINYGSGGIGAEVLANRLRVGPARRRDRRRNADPGRRAAARQTDGPHAGSFGRHRQRPGPGLRAGNPGYPFFVPALAGHRAPKPPLDTI